MIYRDKHSAHPIRQALREKMRKDKSPYLLEVKTYRYKGHSVSDPATYRSKEELEVYKQKDPIIKLRDYILEKKLEKEARLEQIMKEASAEVKKSEEFADQSSNPSIDTLYKYVFSED